MFSWWICCCKHFLMCRLICEKGLLLFLKEHMLWIFVRLPHWDDSNKCPKHMFLEISNAMFLHNFWLTVIYWAKVSCQSNYYYNKFCRCIECRCIDCTAKTVRNSLWLQWSIWQPYLPVQTSHPSKRLKFYSDIILGLHLVLGTNNS